MRINNIATLLFAFFAVAFSAAFAAHILPFSPIAGLDQAYPSPQPVARAALPPIPAQTAAYRKMSHPSQTSLVPRPFVVNLENPHVVFIAHPRRTASGTSDPKSTSSSKIDPVQLQDLVGQVARAVEAAVATLAQGANCTASCA